MTISVRVDTSVGLVVVACTGVVTADEFARHVAPLVEAPEYRLMPLTLVDTSDALRGDGPSTILIEHARRAAEYIDDVLEGGARVAIVATLDEFFGLARMYEMLRDGSPVECQVFRSLPEAEQWLGLSEDYESGLSDVI
jgi:hypothetical protein